MSHIQLEKVSLDYILPIKKSIKEVSIRSLIGFSKQNKQKFSSSHRALEHINLTIEHGDRIGLIGRNGAGKTSLLKVMAKIYHPTTGYIRSDGKISSLLNINVGLNSGATGYENIISLGLLFGKKKQEMMGYFNEIEAFTELGKFLKFPVKTYSSGMKLRLVFAVATVVEPDILLMDEVIGVGDAGFQLKAKKRLAQLIGKSNILVVSTHSMGMIQKFCNKVLVLDKGKKVYYGMVQQGIKIYRSLSKYT